MYEARSNNILRKIGVIILSLLMFISLLPVNLYSAYAAEEKTIYELMCDLTPNGLLIVDAGSIDGLTQEGVLDAIYAEVDKNITKEDGKRILHANDGDYEISISIEMISDDYSRGYALMEASDDFGNGSWNSFEFFVRYEDPSCDIVDIDLTEIVAYEHATGHKMYSYDYDMNIVDQWFEYDFDIAFNLEVTYQDGTVGEYNWESGDPFKFIPNGKSSDTELGLGEHTFYYGLHGIIKEGTFTIIENPILDIRTSEIHLIENANGYMHTDEEGNSYFVYFMPDPGLFLEYQDSTGWHPVSFELANQFCDIEWNHGRNNQFSLGTNTCEVTFAGHTKEATVIVEEYPITDIRTNYTELFASDCIDHSEEYDYYFIDWELVNNGAIEVLLNDEWVTYDIELDRLYGPIEILTDQGPDNVWEEGEHSYTVRLGSLEETGTINILGSPIKDFYPYDITIYEGQYQRYRTEIYGEPCDGWLYYDIWDYYMNYDNGFNVLLSDGSVVPFTEDLYDVMPISFGVVDDDQTPYEPWGVGTHDVSVEFCGITHDVTVTILESPIVDYDLGPIRTIVNTNGYYEYYSREDGSILDEPYFRYLEDSNFTAIYLDDGTVLTNFIDMVSYINTYGLPVTKSDQSENNPWGVGVHEYYVYFAGIEKVQELEVVESNIVDFNVSTIEIYENSKGYMATDEDGNDYFYYYYDCSPYMTITTSDGQKIALESEEGQELAFDYGWPWMDDDQYSKHWKAGKTYTYTVSFAGIEKTAKVKIVKSPVSSLSNKTISIYEGTNGWYEDDLYFYDLESILFNNLSKITVKYTDGTSKKLNEDLFYELGIDYEALNNYQREGHELVVGVNTIPLTIGGKKCSFKLTIKEFPYSEIIGPESLEIFEGANIISSYRYGEVDPIMQDEYSLDNFIYRFKLIDQDGEEIDISPSQLNWDFGVNVNFKTSQEYEPWVVNNEYDATLVIGPLKYDLKVQIVEPPIKDFSVDELTLRYHQDGYWIWYGTSEECYQYDYYNLDVELVHLDDSHEVVSLSAIPVRYEGASLRIVELDSNWLYDLEPGTYNYTAKLFGIEKPITVNIIEQDPEIAPIMDRLDIEVMLFGETSEEREIQTLLPNRLVKFEYDEENEKVFFSLKSEEDYISEGKTREDYIRDLDCGIPDLRNANILIIIEVKAPYNTSNPVALDEYGSVIGSRVYGYDDVLGNEDSYDLSYENQTLPLVIAEYYMIGNPTDGYFFKYYVDDNSYDIGEVACLWQLEDGRLLEKIDVEFEGEMDALLDIFLDDACESEITLNCIKTLDDFDLSSYLCEVFQDDERGRSIINNDTYVAQYDTDSIEILEYDSKGRPTKANMTCKVYKDGVEVLGVSKDTTINVKYTKTPKTSILTILNESANYKIYTTNSKYNKRKVTDIPLFKDLKAKGCDLSTVRARIGGPGFEQVAGYVEYSGVIYGMYDGFAYNGAYEYSVTYNLNGGTNSSKNPTVVNSTDEAIKLSNPKKTGYTFKGWFDNPEFNGTKITSIPKFATSDYELYAKWVPTEYTITYELNSGKNNLNPTTYNIESDTIDLTIEELNPTRKGYEFKGWYRDSEFKNEVTEIPAGSHGAITLYAKWSKVTYYITYDLAGGEEVDNKTKYNVTTSTITLNNPTRTGYTFLGWIDLDTGVVVTTIKKGSTGDRNFVATWELKEYKINYKGMTGASHNNPTIHTVLDDEIILNNPTVDKTGYTFGGWYSSSKYTKAVTKIAANSTGTKNIYAKWVPIEYSVSYDLDGGKNSSKNPKKYTIESEDFKLKDPSKTGYTFKGWYTEPEFVNKVTKIALGSTGDLELYAKWVAKDYTITYNLNSGKNNLNPATYNIESETIDLTNPDLNPTRKGYAFKGWYSDSALKTKVESIEAGSHGNVTLYAKWSKVKYTLTYNLDGGALKKGVTNPSSYYVTTSTITLNNPTRKGYTFKGWMNDETGNIVTTIKKGTTGDKSFTAIWEEK